MTAKEQKLYSFYSQCIAKGYTDMADDTQSLKAKVIASDLDLKYGKIAVLYVEAKKVFELEEARRKVEAEQAAQEAIRTSVLGELVLTLREDPNNNRGRIDVYRRPDGSVYCTHNREETKFEGTPDIQVNKGGVLSYTYHPSRTIFTGASSGGISMGGFHQTKAYTTEKVSDTGKGDIYAKSGDMNIWVKYIDFSDATDHAFRRDETYKSLSQGKRIICFNSSNASFSRDMIGMAMKSGAGYQDVLSKASLANDMMKLSMGEIQRIAAFLNEVISGNYPETDEEYYTKAVRLSDSTKSDDLMKAAQIFRKIIDYKDSSSRVDSIQKKYEEVLQEEKENRILQKERVDRKRKKALSIIAVLAIIGLVTALVVTKVIIPNEHYKNAVALKNAGNYEEAINAFSVLNHYKDSEEQIKECKYYYAISLKDSGSFEEAITAFKQLNGYNDSAEQISSCEICIKDKNYKAAVALKDAGSYAEAITAFEQLNGYRDSVEQINSCKICIQDENYKKAVALKDAGFYAEAITAFEQLNGYRDSVEQINSCKICIQDIVYNEAKKLKDNGEYKKAISKYLSLGDYQDSAEQIVECELSKMKDAKTGSWITFGAYEQDNDFSNGKEEITWIVLKRTNDSILVTSEYALDCQQYNTQSGVRDATTWEKCSLRKWLNEDFLNSAFSEAEQMHIKNETIPAYKNPDYNTDPGNPTTDKVFLLSINEADKYLEYGFERACHPTEYAKTQGVWINERTECCWWWLRTPGSSGFYAALVNHEGSIVPRGGHVNDDDNSTGVRPVLWISID